jgi:hypothetical protein
VRPLLDGTDGIGWVDRSGAVERLFSALRDCGEAVGTVGDFVGTLCLVALGPAWMADVGRAS